MFTSKLIRRALAGTAALSFALAGPVMAQDINAKDMPACSATVTDHCMQMGGHKMDGHKMGGMHREHHAKGHHKHHGRKHHARKHHKAHKRAMMHKDAAAPAKAQ